MREYKLSPLFFSQMRRRILSVGLPIMLLALVVGVLVGAQSEQSITRLLITVSLILILLAFSFTRAIRQQQKHWARYRLIIDENSIKKVQHGLAEIAIGYDEISKITESSSAGLVVQALTPYRQIAVPTTLEGYSELRLELASRYPFENIPENRARWMQLVPVLAGVATLVAFVVTIASPNPYVSGIVGTLLASGLVVSFISIQGNTQTTKQVKRGSILIIFPLLAIIVRVLVDVFIIVGSP